MKIFELLIKFDFNVFVGDQLTSQHCCGNGLVCITVIDHKQLPEPVLMEICDDTLQKELNIITYFIDTVLIFADTCCKGIQYNVAL